MYTHCFHPRIASLSSCTIGMVMAYLLTKVPRVENKGKAQVVAACKRKKEERHTSYLPGEILFNILLLVSVEVLHVVRYVCKQWYDIVSDPLFVNTHRQLSYASLLFQEPQEMHRFYYIEGDTTELKGTEIKLPFPAKLWGSINGLVLLHDMTNTELFHVMNPVTKVKITLPQLVGGNKYFGSTGFAIDSSGHYKVVHVSEEYSMQVQMRIFTVGVDKAWRFIDLQGISMNSRVKATLLYRPCFIAGFLYWCTITCCFAMDIDSETIYQFSRPSSDWDCSLVRFMRMETSVGVIKGQNGIWRL